MTLGSRGGRTRCLLVWTGATLALVVVCRLTVATIEAGGTAVVRHRVDTLPLDRALVELAAALLVCCAVRLWLVTTYVVLGVALRGTEPARPTAASSRGLRRLVLVACGAAVAGALAQPALAADVAPRHHVHLAVDSRVDGLPLPERAAVARPRAPAVVGQQRPDRAVVVVAGDTLWSIAAHSLAPGSPDAAIARRWHAIYRANQARIGPDPDLIVPGLRLRIPGKDLR